MSNPGQPDIKRGDKGTAVLRAQRALRRTPDLSVDVDGDFGPDTEAGVKRFQVSAGLTVDGIVGKDTLLEAGADLYEMLDLKFEKCRLCLAGFPDRNSLSAPHLRVATKYVNTAKKLFLSRGEDVEIIKLNGSIELAPLTGLSDVIFDIVQSGGTLRANGLVVLEEIFDISARLVANKVSLKTKAAQILPLISKMKKYIGE